MNQNEFFNILMDGLKDLPEIELQDIISYYENNFMLGLASGKTENEIINQIGNPNLIINKYRNKDLETPINSEYIINEPGITPGSNNNSIHASNSDNNDTILTKDQNIISDSSYNDIFTEFKIDDNFNNNDKCDSNYKSNSSNYNFDSNQNSDSNLNKFDNQNLKNKISQFNVNTILKIGIVILAVIIFFPVITGIIGCILGLLGVAIGILVGSIGLLIGGTFTNFVGLPNVPMFVANFPYPVIVLLSLGSILLSLFLTLLFYYLCKFFIRLSIKTYTSLKSKGGSF